MPGPNSSNGVPMGGMSPQRSGESSVDENSVMQAMSSANGQVVGQTGSGTNLGKSGTNSSSQSQASSAPKKIEPREVGSIQEEVKRGVGDVKDEIKQFFSINSWLGIDPNTMSPEEEARAEQFHARYQQLDQEQQAVAKQMYQEKMQKHKLQEEEERRKKEIEAQKKAQSVVMPSSPQKGAQGPGGSSKQRAAQKLQRDRTTLSTTQGE